MPSTPSMSRTSPARAENTDGEERRLALVIRLAFFLLLLSALARYVQRHGAQPQVPAVLALAGALALLYVVGRRTAAGAAAAVPGARAASAGAPAGWAP